MSERSTRTSEDIIEVLDCDLAARPAAAPGVDALLPLVRRVTRAPRAVVVEFDQQSAVTLEAFVEAERLCCSGIGWEIERGPTVVRLRITAEDTQLAAIVSLWKR